MKYPSLLLFIFASGCSTCLTINDGTTYAGVKADVAGIKKISDTTSAWEVMPHWAEGLLCVVDLPLSAVADTVVFPYTFCRRSRNMPDGRGENLEHPHTSPWKSSD